MCYIQCVVVTGRMNQHNNQHGQDRYNKYNTVTFKTTNLGEVVQKGGVLHAMLS